MNNLRMKEKLEKGEAIDVSICGRNDAGDYILENFVDGMDYCDAKTEEWIWSIGGNDHCYFASTSAKFRDAPGFECVWLR